MKKIFTYLIPLILPSLIYFIRSYLLSSNKEKMVKQDYPFAILIILGVILTIIFLSVFTIDERAPTSAKYEPPKYENGQLIPAKMKY